VNATIAVMVVPPPARPARKRRASENPTIAGEAVKPSQQHTVAVPAVPQQHTQVVPAVPQGDDAIAKGLTVVPTAQTVFASDGSSCELPFDAEIVFEPAPPPPRPVTVRRRITLGDGVLERVPQRRAWLLPTIVALTTLAAALVVVVAT
jgi:hypothetical protein